MYCSIFSVVFEKMCSLFLQNLMYFYAPKHLKWGRNKLNSEGSIYLFLPTLNLYPNVFFSGIPNTFDFDHTPKTFLFISPEIPTLIIQATSNVVSPILFPTFYS